jgi:hypothetical protein
MKTIFEDWQKFREKIIPKEAGAIQVEECRRAFYAGCAAMFSLTMEATDPKDEDECCENLSQLEAELTAFSHDMKITN